MRCDARRLQRILCRPAEEALVITLAVDGLRVVVTNIFTQALADWPVKLVDYAMQIRRSKQCAQTR